MTDSLLGDYDFCFEAGPALLTPMVAAALTGNVQLPVQQGNDSGAIKITSVAAQAGNDRQLGTFINVTVSFSCGQFSVSDQWTGGISSQFAIHIPVSLDKNAQTGLTALTLHPERSFLPDPVNVTDTNTLLLLGGVMANAKQKLQAMPPSAIGPAFAVVPGSDGALDIGGTVQLSRADLTVMGSPDGQALVVLACVTAASAMLASPGKKTAMALVAGQQVAALTSAATVRFIADPLLSAQLATGLNVPANRIPGPMGPSGSPVDITATMQANNKNVSHATLNSMVLAQTNGSFDIAGVIDLTDSEFGIGIPATINFSVIATPSVGSDFGLKVIDIAVTTPKPTVTVSSGFLLGAGALALIVSLLFFFPVSLLVALVAGSVAMYAVGQAQNSAANQFQSTVSDKIRKALSGSTTAEIFLPWPLTPSSIVVTPTHVALGLSVATPAQAPSPSSRLSHNADMQASGTRTVASSGLYDSQTCPVGQFPYTEYNQAQACKVTLGSEMLCRPFGNVAWTLNEQALLADGQAHTLQLTTTSHYLLPLPEGADQRRSISVGYTLSSDGSVLTLAPGNPADGNYTLRLHTTLTDHDGVSAQASSGVQISNDSVEIGGDFDSKYKVCVLISTMAMQQAMQGAHLQPGTGLNINAGAGPDPASYVTDPVSLLQQLTRVDIPGGAAFASQVRMVQRAGGVARLAPAGTGLSHPGGTPETGRHGTLGGHTIGKLR